MNATHYFCLLSAIYLAPHLPKQVGNLFAFVSMVIACFVYFNGGAA